MSTFKTPLRLLAALGLTGLYAPALPAADSAAGGLRWTVPARWQAARDRPMRVATYTIPAAPGREPGECGVFFFGTGQGGSVEDNLARWASQFESASAPKKTVKTVNGLKVHEIDLTGTYLAPSGPMMQSQGKKPGWRLSGAIIEAPEGLVFFKCTGPAATIEKAGKEFEELVKSVTKAAKA
jgi:hypothetical protein